MIEYDGAEIPEFQTFKPGNTLGVGSHGAVIAEFPPPEFRLFFEILIGNCYRFLFRNHCPVLVRHVPAHTQLLKKFGGGVPGAGVVIAMNFQRPVKSPGAAGGMRAREFFAAEILPFFQSIRGEVI